MGLTQYPPQDDSAARIAASINAATAKTTPVDADLVPITDSADSGALKKVTWANIKATLKAYFDPLYAALAGSASQAFSALTLDVGHASDTTLSRSAAGTLAVEGADIITTATAGRRVAQVVTYQTGTVATGTTILPADNTIPQNTEGDQYMAPTITPQNASSTLIIEVEWYGAHTGAAGTTVTAALFQDSTAGALAAGFYASTGSGYYEGISFKHVMTAGTTSATTFKVRAGGSVAGTTTFNGAGGVQYFGGVMASRITITELLP